MPECGESNPISFPVTCVGGVPSITSLSPSSVVAGSGGFTLTVNGTNFRSDSIVRWNGTALVTTFVSSIQLTAAVPGSDVAAIGSANVTVFNPPPGCGESAPFVFSITAPPAIAGAILGSDISTSQLGVGNSTATLQPFNPYPLCPANNQESVVCVGGTLSNLTINTNSDFSGSQSATFTLWVNGVATSLSVAIPLASPAGVYKDTTHSVAINAEDTIRVEVTTTGDVLASAISSWSMNFVNSDGATIIGDAYGFMFVGFSGALANKVYWISLVNGTDAQFSGVLTNPLTGSNNLFHLVPWATPGTIQKAYLRTTAPQPGTGDMVVTLYKGATDATVAPTSLSVTVPAGSPAGIYKDLAHTVSVNAGDLLIWIYENKASSAPAPLANLMAECVPTVAGTITLVGGGSVGTATGDPQYLSPYIGDQLYGTNKDITCFVMPRNGTLKNFYLYDGPGSPGKTCTVTVLKKGVATPITVSLTSGVGGPLFSDTTHSAAVVQGDTVTLEVVGGSQELIGVFTLELV